MKYGSYLERQRAEFPAPWQAHFVAYDALKAFLKTRMVDTSVHLATAFPPAHAFAWAPEAGPAFDEVLARRLARVAELTPAFVRLLDAEVARFNAFFVEAKDATKATLARVLDRAYRPQVRELEDALSALLLLERFVFLNFTAVSKALKKHDKWSGLQIRGPYLLRAAALPFVTSTSLMRLKPDLLARLTALLGEGAPVATSPPPPPPPPLPASDVGSVSVAPPAAAAAPDQAPSASPTLDALVGLMQQTQTVMISLRGPHGTDIIGGVLGCLSKHRCQIADFSLSRLHHDVTFGVLVHLHNRDVDLFSDLVATAQRWDGTLSFDVQDAQLKASRLATAAEYGLDEAPYAQRTKYIATVLNERGLSAVFLSEWLTWLLSKRISVEQMRRLDRRHSSLMCVEFRLSVPDTLSADEMRAELIALSAGDQTDVALQPDNVFRRQKRLVVFDMDSTLIQQEVIDEIARATGIEEQVARITERAMQGEMDFAESLAARVALLRDTPVEALEDVKRTLTFTDGARYLCRALKSAGFKLAVISGGFLPLARYVKAELGLDYAFANQLGVTADGRRLTGTTVGPVVDAARKAELLEVIAQAEGIAIDQVVAVGDGANDLLMLAKASLGIAFNAKPRVQQQARARINQKSLANILYLMGYSQSEAAELQLPA
ncbi:Phosphoserine phosphatase [Coemansia javaensis]|uniref:phosphoserine phosphatase n=1 Tax=Coemansia javaensis TaxID=2761396 RepID=A0A9W8HHI6_9FUNG|nr:Phosphoserine phosphatase [Coemansia javaensis]